jgi:hypothetical protein
VSPVTDHEVDQGVGNKRVRGEKGIKGVMVRWRSEVMRGTSAGFQSNTFFFSAFTPAASTHTYDHSSSSRSRSLTVLTVARRSHACTHQPTHTHSHMHCTFPALRVTNNKLQQTQLASHVHQLALCSIPSHSSEVAVSWNWGSLAGRLCPSAVHHPRR